MSVRNGCDGNGVDRGRKFPPINLSPQRRLIHDLNNSLSSIMMNIQFITEPGVLSGEPLEAALEARDELVKLNRGLKDVDSKKRAYSIRWPDINAARIGRSG